MKLLEAKEVAGHYGKELKVTISLNIEGQDVDIYGWIVPNNRMFGRHFEFGKNETKYLEEIIYHLIQKQNLFKKEGE